MQTIKKQIIMVLCDRCGNTWQPRVKKPIKCPKCGHRFDSKITATHKKKETSKI